MKAWIFSTILVLALASSTGSFADELPHRALGFDTIRGGAVDFPKAGLDTINLMAASDDPTNTSGDGPCHGVEPYYDGDFEEGWNGWTSIDFTQPTTSHWQVSDWDGFSTFPSLRAWCGDATIEACGLNDPPGGYGNHWHDQIMFTVAVGNPSISAQVNVSAMLQHDTEPGYDFTYLSYRLQGQPMGNIVSWDGKSNPDPFDGSARPVAVSGSVTYIPIEYLDGTHIAVYWRFKSDSGWSDQDCIYPTAGACMVDDVTVTVAQGQDEQTYFEDFESGTLGIWQLSYPDGVGDFAELYTGLYDADPCSNNFTQQVAFIDDGVVVPGTDGSQCINWCYGPGGYIVTTTGGLAGPSEHIHNGIVSPVMTWPQAKDCGVAYDGFSLAFDCYIHEDLSADAPGNFMVWGVRSADTDGSAGDPQVITEQGWQDYNSVIYGGPNYIRYGGDISDLLNPGRDEVQVMLAVYELGYAWFWTGNDGYPAPYFDNVSVKVFPYFGPSLGAGFMAQDNFPERGTIDYGDLPSHSVRFDSANDISYPDDPNNDPGDSLVVTVVPIRAGSELVGVPTMHYKLMANPVFTADMRTSGLPAESSIPGMPAVGISGQVTPDMWAFDLPDTGFLFPGDVLHYYFEATDVVGDGDPQTAIMPADTTGFSDGFGDPLSYSPYFVMQALPSIRNDGSGGHEQPGLLFIKDASIGQGWNHWITALNNLGLMSQEDYDIYFVQASGSGLGNGIGGRASELLLADYTDILYTSGLMGVITLSNGDGSLDSGDDVATLSNWLDLGGKDIFLTGDNLASDLAQSGVETLDFLEQKMGVACLVNDVRQFIGNQTSPRVDVIPGNPVFLQSSSLSQWIAYGGCFDINTFDGVVPFGTGQKLAEFHDPLGVGYQYSACTLNILDDIQSRVISMPVDFMFVETDPNEPGRSLPARVQLLRDVLEYFSITGDPLNVSGTADTPGIMFTTSHYPNPFNPRATIKYSMPRAGHLSLCIFNVRGQLVKTLIDGIRPAGAHQAIVWDGTDNDGAPVSSGVYFCEARTGDEINVRKMALIK